MAAPTSPRLDANGNPVVTDNSGVIPKAVPISYVFLTFLLLGICSVCCVHIAMVDVPASISRLRMFALLNKLDKLFVIICLCYFWIKSNPKLLIYSTCTLLCFLFWHGRVIVTYVLCMLHPGRGLRSRPVRLAFSGVRCTGALAQVEPCFVMIDGHAAAHALRSSVML